MTTRHRLSVVTAAVRFCLAVAVLGFTTLASSQAVQAHEPDATTISLTPAETGFHLTANMPLDDVEVAYGLPGDLATPDVVAAEADGIAQYVTGHASVTGTDGEPWTLTVTNVFTESQDGVDYVTVTADAVSPNDHTDEAVLTWDALIHEVISHKAHTVIGADTAVGADDSAAALLGTFSFNTAKLTVSLGVTQPWQTTLLDGLHHVREGADHLLFVLLLMLPAVLIARSVAGPLWNAWVLDRPLNLRRVLGRVLAVVTAFTVGHTLTLIAAARGLIEFNAAVMETLIAISVGVAAVHALTPLHRLHAAEPIIAGGFGLVHGLAFGGILTDLGLSSGATLGHLIAFNVGVELAQLAVVAFMLPSLLVLATTRWYHPVRYTLAGFSLTLALCWVGDRAFGLPHLLGGVEDWAVANQPIVAGAMALIAAAAFASEHARTSRGVDASAASDSADTPSAAG